MIVVAILAILSALAIPAYQGYITAARQGASRGNIESLRLAVENYRLDHMAVGYAPLDGLVWEPAGSKTLTPVLDGWEPDGDEDQYNYAISAPSATDFTITVTPIGHSEDAKTFSK
jgi:type IV pilus assembly protein PilE